VTLIISVDKSTEEIYTEIKSTEYNLSFHGNTPELSICLKNTARVKFFGGRPKLSFPSAGNPPSPKSFYP
jgi:hypothetical protein